MVLNVVVVKKQYIHKMTIAEMIILRWISGNTLKDRIRNEKICLNIGVTSIDEKTIESCLRYMER